MAKNKNKSSRKKHTKKTSQHAVPKKTRVSLKDRITMIPGWFAQKTRKLYSSTLDRNKNYLRRRPHRSFRLTRRRDYKRSLNLPGYFSLTIETFSILWKNKATFILLAICFFVLFVAFNLVGSQGMYQNFHDLLWGTAPSSVFGGFMGEVSKAGILLFTTVTQGLNGDPLDSGQKFMSVFIGIYVWLTVIWLLRNIFAGRKVRLRDGIYNSGSPIISTILIFIVLLIQMIPVAVAIIVGTTAWQSGLIDGGAWAMLASIALILVVTVTLYWITSTVVALVVITLPGMYPMRALAISGDLVVGRRLRLVYRFIWMVIAVVSIWVVVMIPVILFDDWIKSVYESISWLPIVPVMLLVMSTFSIIWTSTYIYLLYRRMVDDDASPA